jgi:hypothetical protein
LKVDRQAVMSDLPPRGRLCYGAAMTKLFEHAVDVARGLPPEVQDDLARVLLELAGEDQPVVELTPAEEASLQGSLAQADRREFATDEEVRSVWAKYGL